MQTRRSKASDAVRRRAHVSTASVREPRPPRSPCPARASGGRGTDGTPRPARGRTGTYPTLPAVLRCLPGARGGPRHDTRLDRLPRCAAPGTGRRPPRPSHRPGTGPRRRLRALLAGAGERRGGGAAAGADARRANGSTDLLAETRVHEIPVPHGYGGSLADAIPRMLRGPSSCPVISPARAPAWSNWLAPTARRWPERGRRFTTCSPATTPSSRPESRSTPS